MAEPFDLFYLPFRPALDANGIVVAGASLTFYASGTTTLQPIYADAALTTLLANPLTANSAGVWPAIYIDNSLVYRVVLRNGEGAPLNEVDPYRPGSVGGPEGPAGGDANSYPDLVALKNALPTGLSYTLRTTSGPIAYAYVPGDFTGKADDINVVKLNGTPLTTGALVRQAASGISTQQATTNAPPRDLSKAIADQGLTATGAGATGGVGTADDSAPLAAMIAGMTASARVDGYFADPVTTTRALIPGGTFRVTQGQALLPASVVKTVGYSLSGIGAGTRVVFDATNSVLFANTNGYLLGTVRDMFFSSTSGTNGFMASISDDGVGAVQDFSFDRVAWDGSWLYAFQLKGNMPDGGNNNSEFSWRSCRASGTYGLAFLHIPNDSAGSDQSLNHWLPNFASQISSGAFVDMGRGGHVKITDSDFSGHNSGTLFNYRGFSHAFGVCFSTVRGTRFEHKTDASTLHYSEWPQGVHLYDNIDQSSQANVISPGTIMVDQKDANSGGAAVVFRDSVIIGTHRYSHGSNEFEYKAITEYRNTTFLSHYDLFDAFAILSSVNDFGSRGILIENCRGKQEGFFSVPAHGNSTAYALGAFVRWGNSIYKATVAGTSAASGHPTGKTTYTDGSVTWSYVRNCSRDYVTDCMLGGQTIRNPNVRERVASFGGGLPAYSASAEVANGARELILPSNVEVFAGKLFAPAGAVASGATASYTIALAGTTLVSVTSGALSAGFDQSATFTRMTGSTIASRTLTLTPGASVDTAIAAGIARISYVG